jgi:hypothetical protein
MDENINLTVSEIKTVYGLGLNFHPRADGDLRAAGLAWHIALKSGAPEWFPSQPPWPGILSLGIANATIIAYYIARLILPMVPGQKKSMDRRSKELISSDVNAGRHRSRASIACLSCRQRKVRVWIWAIQSNFP